MGSKWLERNIRKDTINNCFAKCGFVVHCANTDDDENVDEQFNNLFEELFQEVQIDGDITADEYSNFDQEISTSFPSTNSDEVYWRRVSEATSIQEYGAPDDIAIEVESDDDSDEDNDNESDVSQVSLQETMNLLDMLVHVDDMSEDDTNALLTTREKMESLIIQQKRFSIEIFSKN